MILYRPVGLKELELIAEMSFERFPARLPAQPIFYPALHFEYAVQIAHDWNTKDPASGYAGFVLRFEVEDDYLENFPIQTVGSSQHQELWVPAEELETFNFFQDKSHESKAWRLYTRRQAVEINGCLSLKSG